ncbi:unnamed protein product [Leptosia nina]|uniref:Death domain-containing protein n=1 Tax=Leptosia nina TaxID=320188 RepID=A0AAV1JWI8_9NEOP
MTLLEYNQLKRQVIYNFGLNDNNNNLLGQLKEFYRTEIDSNRRFDEINTIGQLINILELRNTLSEDNISPLKEIAQRLNNNEIIRLICDYEKSHLPKGSFNYYATEQNIATSKEFIDPLPTGHPYGNITHRKKARIIEKIVEEIGTNWRDLARNLRIQEGQIDEIDKTKETLAEKATELLKLYERKADPQRGFYYLCNALENARRRDLSRSLQKIIVMNI